MGYIVFVVVTEHTDADVSFAISFWASKQFPFSVHVHKLISSDVKSENISILVKACHAQSVYCWFSYCLRNEKKIESN